MTGGGWRGPAGGRVPVDVVCCEVEAGATTPSVRHRRAKPTKAMQCFSRDVVCERAHNKRVRFSVDNREVAKMGAPILPKMQGCLKPRAGLKKT